MQSMVKMRFPTAMLSRSLFYAKILKSNFRMEFSVFYLASILYTQMFAFFPITQSQACKYL